MLHQIVILGTGAMGTLCADLLHRNGHPVRIWGANADHVRTFAATRENARLFAGYRLPREIQLTGDDSQCFARATCIISAIPTQYLRTVWTRLAPHYRRPTPIVSVAKGIEIATLHRPTQVISEVLGDSGGGATRPCVAALSGPNIACEIAHGLPATAVVASLDAEFAATIQSLFTGRSFRIYTNSDVIGVEIAGAVKNVIALAAGMIDGLALGSNAKAALLTRGLVEITRLGMALGAQPATFSGLAGLGDLVTTCISPDGRNRRTGELLGRGQALSQVLAQSTGVIEGVSTTAAVVKLARQLEVDMPITQAVYSILFENKTPAEALESLMSRQIRAEWI